MPNEINVYLVVYDFSYDPSAITEATGLIPCREWRKGEQKRHSIDIFPENGWKFRVDSDKSYDLEIQLDLLFRQIEPALPVLIKLRESARIEISCMLFAHDFVPPMHFSSSAVSSIALLGAEVDIDLYVLSHEADSASGEESRTE